MVKCAGIERGTVPKFFCKCHYGTAFVFYRFELRYYVGAASLSVFVAK